MDTMSETARVTISMDFELGWGTVSNGRWRDRQTKGVYKDLRPALRFFLDQLDGLGVPLTWATVGAMVEEPHKLDFGHLPDPIRELTEQFVIQSEPTTHDGRDLLDMVLRANARHDIGSHTFSHCRYDTLGYSREAKAKDLALANHALGKNGVVPVSFVFPENNASDLDILQGADLRYARLAPIGKDSGKLQRLITKVKPPPMVQIQPSRYDLATETGTMFYHWPTNRSGALKKRLVQSQSRRALDKALRTQSAIHLWLHPFNLVEIPGLMDALLVFLQILGDHQQAGRLEVSTMADLVPGKYGTSLL